MIPSKNEPKSVNPSIKTFADELRDNSIKIIINTLDLFINISNLSCFNSNNDELDDFQPTSHATCMKELGESISSVQKGSTSLTDKLSDTNSEQSRLADDSAKLIEAQSNTIKESISLASENAQTITYLQNELFSARRELLATKLLKSPENMQAMQIYMASIAEKISTYEKIEEKLVDEMKHSDTLEARCIKLTDCVVRLATENKSQKETITNLEQHSSYSPSGAM